MNKFIQLTLPADSDFKKINININHIVCFFKSDSGGTYIKLNINGNYSTYEVLETPEKIYKIINE